MLIGSAPSPVAAKLQRFDPLKKRYINVHIIIIIIKSTLAKIVINLKRGYSLFYIHTHLDFPFTGGMPYPKMKTPELLTQLKAHHRMDWPKHCSTEFYDLMLSCWHRRPESRPTFDMLMQELKKLRGSGKVS